MTHFRGSEQSVLTGTASQRLPGSQLWSAVSHAVTFLPFVSAHPSQIERQGLKLADNQDCQEPKERTGWWG